MAIITEDELLERVKKSNLITNNFLDEQLTEKIKEVKSFMFYCGVPQDVLDSDIVIGTIAIGVNDLLSPLGTGGTQKFSPYFMQRVIQLR
ncbi:MAG: hypothetical protein IKC11_03075 [Clostridia bacterium]|nr:hypothetical protein [Clostridia bacterium]